MKMIDRKAELVIEIGHLMDMWQYDISKYARDSFKANKEKLVTILEDYTRENPNDMDFTAQLSAMFDKMEEQMLSSFAIAVNQPKIQWGDIDNDS